MTHDDGATHQAFDIRHLAPKLIKKMLAIMVLKFAKWIISPSYVVGTLASKEMGE